MADPHALSVLKRGASAWNTWRAHPDDPSLVKAVDLRNADLCGLDLTGANLIRAQLDRADFTGSTLQGGQFFEAQLNGANFSGANLERADLGAAFLIGAALPDARLNGASLLSTHLDLSDLRGAEVRFADFLGATLSGANLSGADLRGSRLIGATLVGTNLAGANISGCSVFGVSAWKLNLEKTIQTDLNISDVDEPAILVDNLEVAQFIYLLLNNARVRDVIDTITSKVVLILGSFSGLRKHLLDAMREALRQRNYLPILFDFEKPFTRDRTEAVSTLAHMARFVIADMTDARGVLVELMRIVPSLPSVPVQRLILSSQEEAAMADHFERFPWVLPKVPYASQQWLLDNLDKAVLVPVEGKLREIRRPHDNHLA